MPFLARVPLDLKGSEWSMLLTVITDLERYTIDRSVTSLTIYLRSRRGQAQDRTYQSLALDGALISLQLVKCGDPPANRLTVTRDEQTVRVYAVRRWYRAVELFMVLTTLVPRD